ncbi:MAG: aldehyde dehydrogenase family protein, partial [Pseudomonadota bacterium]|nr:aldehyde dehydrogenase family protein [Pseudomonadota bacterium]
NPAVRKLGFTGSTGVGKLLMQQAAGTVKKVSLELGGNAPLIIFDDADLDRAVEGAIACKYRNSGQTCVCTNRIFVQDGVYDAFAERFTRAVGEMKQGNGFDDGVTVGPMITMAAVEKVEAHVADAVGQGAQVVAGGARSNLGGLFYQPTILTEATPKMRIFKEETFGPVAPLFRFQDEEDVIAMANDTEYGLAAYFYARDLGRVWRVAEALEYGMVAVNEGILSTEVAPFGGMKESGIGREGSKYGLDEFVELKYVLMGGLND